MVGLEDSTHPTALLILSAMILLLFSWFGGNLALPAAEPERPEFVVTLASGKVVQGAIQSLVADWSVQLTNGQKIAGDEVISIRRVGVPLPPLPADEQLILANGDRLPIAGREIRLSGERLTFSHPNLEGEEGKEPTLPLAAVSVYWRIPPDRTAEPEKLRRRLMAGTRARDTVLLRNGDQLEGTLNTLDARVVEVEADKKVRSARIHQVAAVALSTDLADRLKPKGVYARLVLAVGEREPGGRLTLTTATSEGTTLRGKTAFGARLRVPLEQVVALDLLGGRAVYLSDLPPVKYEYFPYLDERWAWTADGTVMGREIRLGGAMYDKGIGMHSHSRLTWKLGGAYQRFEALVGLDDLDGRRGSVQVRVLADDKEVDLSSAGELTQANGPRRVKAQLAGVKELTLEVQHGAGGPVQDVVNWADARLIR
jgi:hypothetical protein